MDLENPSTPAFEATYTDSPCRPILTAREEKFIILPAFDLTKAGMISLVQKIVPIRFVFTIFLTVSSGVESKRFIDATPATFNNA